MIIRNLAQMFANSCVRHVIVIDTSNWTKFSVRWNQTQNFILILLSYFFFIDLSECFGLLEKFKSIFSTILNISWWIIYDSINLYLQNDFFDCKKLDQFQFLRIIQLKFWTKTFFPFSNMINFFVDSQVLPRIDMEFFISKMVGMKIPNYLGYSEKSIIQECLNLKTKIGSTIENIRIFRPCKCRCYWINMYFIRSVWISFHP